MMFLKKMFKNKAPLFEPGEKFERWAGIYRAFETFFFFPSGRTAASPHVRDNLDVKRYMCFVLAALLPVTLFGIYNTGRQSLLAAGEVAGFMDAFSTGAYHVVPVIAVSYGVGFFWEFLFSVVRKKEVTEGLLITGLLFPLTLPPTISLWQVAAGISFGIVIGKEIFGGTGRNLLNPALTARAFIFFSYPASMSGNSVWIAGSKTVDAVSQATPLALHADTGPITDLLVSSGYTLDRLFWGLIPGSIGETSSFLCFAGAAFLIITGIASYRIILGGIAGLIATSLVFALVSSNTGSWHCAGPLYHLLSGGFALGISFMATDPVSGPGTNAGRWVYGFLIGMLTVILRAVNPAFVEGVMLAILFMNIFSPLIDHVTVRLKTRKRIPNV